MRTYSVHDALVNAAENGGGFLHVSIAVDEAKRDLELAQAVEALLLETEVRVRAEALSVMTTEPVSAEPERLFFLGSLREGTLGELLARFGPDVPVFANTFNTGVYALALSTEQVLDLALSGDLKRPIQEIEDGQFDAQMTWQRIPVDNVP